MIPLQAVAHPENLDSVVFRFARFRFGQFHCSARASFPTPVLASIHLPESASNPVRRALWLQPSDLPAVRPHGATLEVSAVSWLPQSGSVPVARLPPFVARWDRSSWRRRLRRL